MRAQRVVGHDRVGDQVRSLRVHPRIQVLTVVAVGPPVEPAVPNGREVVGDEVGPELVAFVDDGPQGVTVRLELQAIRIAKPRGVFAVTAGGAIDFPDRCPPDLRLQPVLRDIAVRADAGVELRAIRARRQALGPVMIDRAARAGRTASRHRLQCATRPSRRDSARWHPCWRRTDRCRPGRRRRASADDRETRTSRPASRYSPDERAGCAGRAWCASAPSSPSSSSRIPWAG